MSRASSQLYEDYYTRHVGGNLAVFVGTTVQRGHGLENLFGILFRSAMPLIKRETLALGKRVLNKGMRVAEDVASGQKLKQAVKRRATEAVSSVNNMLPVLITLC